MADSKIFKFPNEIDTVELNSASAKLMVMQSDDDIITVEYNNPRETPELQAMIVNTSLVVKEKVGFKIFGSWIPGDYQLKVWLPRKIYKAIKINTASGGAEIDGFEAETLEVSTASGNLNITAYADKIKVHAASGNINLTNFNEEKYCSYLETSAVSGNITVNNFTCGEYAIHSVSGQTTYNDISGRGRVSVTSGSININCCDWTNDIDISAISGSINLYLPDDSAANISFSGASGNVRTDLISDTAGHCVSIAKGSSGPYGGGIMHNVNVSLTSGTVSILKSGKPSKFNQPDAEFVPKQEPKEGVFFEKDVTTSCSGEEIINKAAKVVDTVATVIGEAVETAADAIQKSFANSGNNNTANNTSNNTANTAPNNTENAAQPAGFNADGSFTDKEEAKAAEEVVEAKAETVTEVKEEIKLDKNGDE